MALKGKPFAKLGGLLAKFAPTLLTAVGGPAGALAGTIVKSALGDKSMTDDAMASAVEAATQTPEGLQKLRDVEAELQKHETEFGFKWGELDVQDVESARAHEIAMAQQDDRTTRNLAYFVVGAFVSTAVGVLMGYAKVESALAGTIVGYLIGEARQVTSFYFGSSRGSKNKDAALVDIAKG